jgi:hypothetical protein
MNCQPGREACRRWRSVSAYRRRGVLGFDDGFCLHSRIVLVLIVGRRYWSLIVAAMALDRARSTTKTSVATTLRKTKVGKAGMTRTKTTNTSTIGRDAPIPCSGPHSRSGGRMTRRVRLPNRARARARARARYRFLIVTGEKETEKRGRVTITSTSTIKERVLTCLNPGSAPYPRPDTCSWSVLPAPSVRGRATDLCLFRSQLQTQTLHRH